MQTQNERDEPCRASPRPRSAGRISCARRPLHRRHCRSARSAVIDAPACCSTAVHRRRGPHLALLTARWPEFTTSASASVSSSSFSSRPADVILRGTSPPPPPRLKRAQRCQRCACMLQHCSAPTTRPSPRPLDNAHQLPGRTAVACKSSMYLV